MANKIKVSIIGLGYVGLPLAIELGKIFNTVGYDLSKHRIDELQNKNDKNDEISKKDFTLSKKLTFTSNQNDIDNSNYIIISVPTPINKNNKPDLRMINSATTLAGNYLKQDTIVIYESTVYPGLTEEYCVPILSKISGLKWKKNFYVGYSPERINPGDRKHTIKNIIKVISGDCDYSQKKIKKLYSNIIDAGIYVAPDIKTAEASKIIENAQRDINIAFMNELSLIFKRMNVSTHEVLKASKTKWNFLDFRPGLVGGHCIGVDPYYLNFKAEKLKYKTQIIKAGRKINDNMEKIVTKEIKQCLKNKLKSRLLFVGIAFKENCGDTRNSKIINVINNLKKIGFNNIDIFDPLINKIESKKISNLKKNLQIKKMYDLIVINSFHKAIEKKYSKKEIINLIKKKGVLYDINNNFFDFIKKNEFDIKIKSF